MTRNLVPMIMSSKSDLEHAEKIGVELEKWGIEKDYRVASAHKHSKYVLQIIQEYEGNPDLLLVYVTIAGRSDGLSGTVAGHTIRPVIACPPPSDKYAGLVSVSSYYMPSRTPVMYVPDPENAAMAAARIFALSDEKLSGKLNKLLADAKREIEEADRELRGE